MTPLISYISDCKFMMYPPSMIAAGSLGAAAHGLLKSSSHKLLGNLHQILGIDIVSVNIQTPWT